MSYLQNAIRITCNLSAHTRGPRLWSEADIVKYIRKYFNKIREEHEVLYNNMWLLDLSHGWEEIEAVEDWIAGGQCLRGALAEIIEEGLQQPQAAGDHRTAELTRQYFLNKVILYEDNLATSLMVLSNGRGITPRAVRFFIQFVLGHENRHAQQSREFIMRGRTQEINSALMTGNEEELRVYVRLISESDADFYGLQKALDVINKEM